MSDTGNGHMHDVSDDVMALDERLSEVEAANVRLLALQERFQAELTSAVCEAVATVLERRFDDVNRRLDGISGAVAALDANVMLAVRRP